MRIKIKIKVKGSGRGRPLYTGAEGRMIGRAQRGAEAPLFHGLRRQTANSRFLLRSE
jgi:hypothetical protein